MKELSIEEKAKRYDEAIKVAKSNYETIVQMDNDCTFAKEGIVNTFHHIFPELKESEGEMIRKDIERAISVALDYCYFNKETANNCLAWLEKQAEHANFRNKIQIGDKVTRNEAGILVNISQLNRVAKPAKRQGGQKLAWGEEDKAMVEDIIEAIDTQYAVTDYNEMVNWLKSLKDRYTWKPSESDILLLEKIANGKSNPQDFQASLWGLIGQLKKLREE